MGLNRGKIVTENIEGYSEYNIDREWYKNRKKGLSAVIRCYGEERWIGPCIESSLPLFDEIIVTLTEMKGDRTEEIVKSFKSPKIKLFKYPFKLHKKGKKRNTRNSVHQFSYYTNWSLAKTNYSHISARWDADHILRPKFATEKFKKIILSKEKIRVRGYNCVTPDFKYLSKKIPHIPYHVRFAKVNPYLCYTGDGDYNTYKGIPQLFYPKRWINFPIQQAQCIINRMLFRDIRMTEPIFFHTKLLKQKENQIEKEGKIHIASDRYDDALLPGKKIDVKPPSCAFKKPEDYLE